jgi:hypothetical protein
MLASALLFNSTLNELDMPIRNCSWLSPLFLALQMNTGLKDLIVNRIGLIDEKLSTAMRLGLGENSTLESLNLSNIKSGDNDISMWREALSFLRINTALKALTMQFEKNATESHATAIRIEVAAMLCENESLETLSMPITSKHARFEDFLVFVAAIQLNTTLKSLDLHPPYLEKSTRMEPKC